MKQNLFNLNNLPPPREEFFEDILRTPDLLIERIISTGQATPPGEWYDQDRDEWVMLVRGKAVIQFESGDTTELAEGDHLLIPSHCRHRVEETSTDPPSFWVAVHGALLSPGNDGINEDKI